jgi:hypothetical protein
LSAIHKEHCFDPTIGRFGIRRGDYERLAVDVLYAYGHSVILDSESQPEGTKTPDGKLDDKTFEIKGIEGTGKQNIYNNIKDASKQGVETLVLFFYDETLFSEERVVASYNTYLRSSKTKRIRSVYYIVASKLHKIEA